VPQGHEQILYAPPIDDGKGMQEHLAVHHLLEQPSRRRARLDLVFPCLDGGGKTLESRVEHPHAGLGNDPLRAEIGRHAHEAPPGRHLEPQRSRHTKRLIEAPIGAKAEKCGRAD
jgi:hypothetical protein